jgi:hypothetical protein
MQKRKAARVLYLMEEEFFSYLPSLPRRGGRVADGVVCFPRKDGRKANGVVRLSKGVSGEDDWADWPESITHHEITQVR